MALILATAKAMLSLLGAGKSPLPVPPLATATAEAALRWRAAWI